MADTIYKFWSFFLWSIYKIEFSLLSSAATFLNTDKLFTVHENAQQMCVRIIHGCTYTQYLIV